MDSQRFVNYYVNQAGNGSLRGFQGVPVMYGRGLGSILSRAFRYILPFLKQGYNIFKPHLKTATKGIASDVVGAVTSKIINSGNRQQSQEGSGLLRITRKKRKKSTASLPRIISKNKKRKTPRNIRTARNHLLGRDIF